MTSSFKGCVTYSKSVLWVKLNLDTLRALETVKGKMTPKCLKKLVLVSRYQTLQQTFITFWQLSFCKRCAMFVNLV